MTYRRRRTMLGALAFGLAVLAASSLKVGRSEISFFTISKTLVDALTRRDVVGSEAVIVWELRVPTLLTALLAGASLGAAGLMMQTFFRNPLAGPDVMGVSAGASLGVAATTLLKGSQTLLPQVGFFSQLGTLAAATLGALAVLLVALVAARWLDDPVTLLVLGLMFGAAAAGMVGLLVNFAHPERLQDYLLWTLGSFDVPWDRLPAFLWLAVIGTTISLLLVKPLNALQLGPEQAKNLGVRLTRVRLMSLGIASLLTGATTAVCGPIAFLGIAAPHLARMTFRTSDHRWLLPSSMLIGAGLAIVIDVAAKTLASPSKLPINTISGVLGAPLVIWLVIRLRPR